MRSPNEVFFLRTRFNINCCFIFFEQLTYLRVILFIFRLLAENFVFIFNYLGSDIFLLLDRTLALDLLYGSVNTWAQDFKANTDSPSPLIFKN